jgi:hypothetical protein
VRVNGERELGSFAEPRDQSVEADRAHRAAALAQEHVLLAGALARRPKATNRAKLITT